MKNTNNLTKYINYLKRQNLANKTINLYTDGVKSFTNYGGNTLSLNKLSKFFQEKAKTLAVNTLISYKTALKSYSRFNQLKLNWKPLTKLIPKEQSRFFPTIDFSELAKLKNTRTERNNFIYQRNSLLMEFLFYTGMRLNEIANLKHNDWQGKQLKVLGKGNKVRFICVPNFLVKYFDNSTNYFFTNNHGQQLSLRTIQQIINDKVKNTKLKKIISTHSFRRSFATNLYKKNGKLETIQKQLGHSSLDTTMRYIHNDYDSFYNDYSKLWKNETILAK